MGKPRPPRIIRSGPLVPTVPRSGSEGDAVIWRKNNLITRGRAGRYYEEVFSGLGDLDESSDMIALTGTLSLTQDSEIVIGTGSAFLTECHLGQFICAIKDDESWLLVVRRVVSDTEMVVWTLLPDSPTPWPTITGLTGWRMGVIWAMNDRRATALRGNAVLLDRGSILGVGDGTLRIDGLPLSASLTLSRRPKIALFNPVAGTYTNSELGMTVPTGITAAAVGGGTKGMRAGAYSLVVTPGHTETDGYNNPSERIDVTIADNDKVQITFVAMDTARLQNRWGVWATPYSATLGGDLKYLEGPWFFVRWVSDTDVSPAGGTFDVEWLDAELGDLVTFDNDAPTDAEFVVVINNIPVWISCQGHGFAAHPAATSPGPFICPAKPGNIDAAPLGVAFSSSPPETILGAVAAAGRIYLLTPNHLQIAQTTPSDIVPIIIRPFWHNGFANPYQLVFINGELYGFPVSGPTRSVGDGDEIIAQHDWAEDIGEIVLGSGTVTGWNPGQVLVGFDPFNNAVVFFHAADRLNDAGFWTTKWFMFGISQDFWIGEGEFSSDTQDSIVSGVATVGDRLELIIGGRGGTVILANHGITDWQIPAPDWAAEGIVRTPIPAEASWEMPPLQWTAEGNVMAAIGGDAAWVIPSLTWTAEGAVHTPIPGEASWELPPPEWTAEGTVVPGNAGEANWELP
jgi:hypothetical protein